MSQYYHLYHKPWRVSVNNIWGGSISYHNADDSKLKYDERHVITLNIILIYSNFSVKRHILKI